MTHEYVHVWVIEDLDRPMSALIAEACRDLDRHVQLAGGRIVGQPQWTVSGDRLVCVAPARACDPDGGIGLPPTVAGEPAPPEVVAEIRRMTGVGVSVSRTADTLMVDRHTVRKYRCEPVRAPREQVSAA
jgi:hypothetical protein